MKIYELNTSYVKYLQQFDKRVLNNEDGGTRKYVGVVLSVNSFNYFVPLSSPKDTDYTIVKGKKVIRKSIVPIHRIVIRRGNKVNFLGKLRFSSMIPVPDTELTLLDIANLTDIKYKNMIIEQVRYIRKNATILMEDHAKVIYNQKTGNYPNIGYLNSTVDFKLLEQKVLEYTTAKETYEAKEQVAAGKEE